MLLMVSDWLDDRLLMKVLIAEHVAFIVSPTPLFVPGAAVCP
jgi:hypothetical protein